MVFWCMLRGNPMSGILIFTTAMPLSPGSGQLEPDLWINYELPPCLRDLSYNWVSILG